MWPSVLSLSFDPESQRDSEKIELSICFGDLNLFLYKPNKINLVELFQRPGLDLGRQFGSKFLPFHECFIASKLY